MTPAPRATDRTVEADGPTWAELIRQYRTLTGTSQNRLAIRLGVRQSTVSKWEQGSAEPGRDSRARLAVILQDAMPDLYPPRSAAICSLVGRGCPFCLRL